VEIEERGHQIRGLRERVDACAFLRMRRLDHEGDVPDLGIDWHEELHPILPLAEHGAVVGGEDDERVVPQAEFLELLKKASAPMVGHRQERGVTFADMFHRFRRFLDHVVVWPIEERAVPCVMVKIAIFLRAMERFVRIEEFNLEKPIVGFLVVVEPAHRRLHGLWAGEVLLFDLARAIFQVLHTGLSQMLG